MLEIFAKFEIVIHVKHSLRTLGTARVFQKQGSSADTLEAREKKKVQSRTKSWVRFIPLKILVLASDLPQMETMLIVCNERKWVSEWRCRVCFQIHSKAFRSQALNFKLIQIFLY